MSRAGTADDSSKFAESRPPSEAQTGFPVLPARSNTEDKGGRRKLKGEHVGVSGGRWADGPRVPAELLGGGQTAGLPPPE